MEEKSIKLSEKNYNIIKNGIKYLAYLLDGGVNSEEAKKLRLALMEFES